MGDGATGGPPLRFLQTRGLMLPVSGFSSLRPSDNSHRALLSISIAMSGPAQLLELFSKSGKLLFQVSQFPSEIGYFVF